MKFLKRSTRATPRISLILLDWSVRESFHLLHYLREQTTPRDAFEVIIVEYYDRRSPMLEAYLDQVDTWLLLEMPRDYQYHKHLMYNAGIVFAHAPVVMIGDSDAMVRPTFIASILQAFERQPQQVLHLDQFRNHRRDFYPFNFPSFDEVLGPGCVNNADGQTAGVRDRRDPLHTRNYGACMCAPRKDLIAIGGADEHIDYVGHICGPYEMTFRLINRGLAEVWHQSEFTYHTWHPGQAGEDNYQGPHDGRQMSTTALEALISGRTVPFVENAAIASLRYGEDLSPEHLAARLIDRDRASRWCNGTLKQSVKEAQWRRAKLEADRFNYKGFAVRKVSTGWQALPLLSSGGGGIADCLEANDPEILQALIEERTSIALSFLCTLAWVYILSERIWQRFVLDRRRSRR